MVQYETRILTSGFYNLGSFRRKVFEFHILKLKKKTFNEKC